jgi:hypothetical protein
MYSSSRRTYLSGVRMTQQRLIQREDHLAEKSGKSIQKLNQMFSIKNMMQWENCLTRGSMNNAGTNRAERLESDTCRYVSQGTHASDCGDIM